MKSQPDLIKCRRTIARALRLCPEDAYNVRSTLNEAHTLCNKICKFEGKKAPRKVKTVRDKLFDKCMDLWSEAIKLRAGHRTEYTIAGGGADLNSHHIMGKKNYWLRFSLDNGICLTSGQHNYMAHGDKWQAAIFDTWIEEYCGRDRLNRLLLLKKKSGKPDLGMVRLQLQAAVDAYK